MKKYPTLVFLLLLIFTILIVHHKSWNTLPTSMHAWAQSDHYAISLGFLDNNFDFFHPQTFSLNHQFPPQTALKDPKGITAIDFPILHYTVAGLMYVLDDISPWIFRFVSLLWSCIALSFLFHTLQKMRGTGVALFLVGFVMLQPIYCYYQNGFHVSSAALNSLILGISFMMKYFKHHKFSFFIYALFFLILAALMRFTHLISLLALGCTYAVLSIKNKKWDHKIGLIIIGVACVLSYFVFNQYLGSKYGSIFLNKPMVSDSFTAFLEQILTMGRNYIKGFLPPFHGIGLVIMIVLLWKGQLHKINFFNEKLLWIIFLFLGASAFTLLMTWHLSVHDYYALDVWMPVLLGLMLFGVTSLKKEIIDASVYRKIGLTLLIGMFSFAVYIQERRYGKMVEKTKADVVINNFKDSSFFLDAIIPAQAKVLVICGSGWNTPMVGWHRNVYRVAWKYAQQIPQELAKDYDFIVTHDSSFQKEVVHHCPTYTDRVYRYKGNGLVTVWKQKIGL